MREDLEGRERRVDAKEARLNALEAEVADAQNWASRYVTILLSQSLRICNRRASASLAQTSNIYSICRKCRRSSLHDCL